MRQCFLFILIFVLTPLCFFDSSFAQPNRFWIKVLAHEERIQVFLPDQHQEPIKIVIYNLLGHPVKTIGDRFPDGSQQVIPVQELCDGIYLMSLQRDPEGPSLTDPTERFEINRQQP